MPESAVRTLICDFKRNGGDVNCRDKEGWTALHLACYFAFPSRDECLSLLFGLGVNINLTTDDGMTALMLAVLDGEISVVDRLLSVQADCNIQDRLGFAPLHHAAAYGRFQLVKRLIEAGADPQAFAKDGQTPLHCAARVGSREIVEYLLENGALFDARTRVGENAEQTAREAGHIELADWLVTQRGRLPAPRRHFTAQQSQYTPSRNGAPYGHDNGRQVDRMELAAQVRASLNLGDPTSPAAPSGRTDSRTGQREIITGVRDITGGLHGGIVVRQEGPGPPQRIDGGGRVLEQQQQQQQRQQQPIVRDITSGWLGQERGDMPQQRQPPAASSGQPQQQQQQQQQQQYARPGNQYGAQPNPVTPQRAEPRGGQPPVRQPQQQQQQAPPPPVMSHQPAQQPIQQHVVSSGAMHPPPAPSPGSTMPSTFEWEIDFAQLRFGKHLGSGSFGEVYRGLWLGSPVAIKTLKIGRQGLDPQMLKDFRHEVDIMSKMRHVNVVLFVGACTSPPNLTIITEYCPRGSLYDVIRTEKDLDWPRKLRIAAEAAAGMLYLHTRNPPIVHRDVKSDNFLVCADYTVKVCDFGLARFRTTVSHVATTHARAGTPAWMAPEVLRGEQFNESSDVYGFGVVLWEMLTGAQPWAEVDPVQLPGLVGFRGARLPLPGSPPPHCPAGFLLLMKDCWEHEPRRRPKFLEIQERLQGMAEEASPSRVQPRSRVPQQSQPAQPLAPPVLGGQMGGAHYGGIVGQGQWQQGQRLEFNQ